jgi:hypothetical protein
MDPKRLLYHARAWEQEGRGQPPRAAITASRRIVVLRLRIVMSL